MAAASANLEEVTTVDLMTELLHRMKCATKPDKRLILVGTDLSFSRYLTSASMKSFSLVNFRALFRPFPMYRDSFPEDEIKCLSNPGFLFHSNDPVNSSTQFFMTFHRFRFNKF